MGSSKQRVCFYPAPIDHGQRIHRVIPQAICAKYGLAIGAACAPFVLTLMYLFGERPSFCYVTRTRSHFHLLAPIAWPMAKLLDWLLGAHDEHTYKKAELKSFLQFHRHGEEPLRDEEISILNGVLSLNEKSASEIMTPWKVRVLIQVKTLVDMSL